MIVSLEKLFHFQCAECEKWWTIGDFDKIYQPYLNCPFCCAKIDISDKFMEFMEIKNV